MRRAWSEDKLAVFHAGWLAGWNIQLNNKQRKWFATEEKEHLRERQKDAMKQHVWFHVELVMVTTVNSASHNDLCEHWTRFPQHSALEQRPEPPFPVDCSSPPESVITMHRLWASPLHLPSSVITQFRRRRVKHHKHLPEAALGCSGPTPLLTSACPLTFGKLFLPLHSRTNVHPCTATSAAV